MGTRDIEECGKVVFVEVSSVVLVRGGKGGGGGEGHSPPINRTSFIPLVAANATSVVLDGR